MLRSVLQHQSFPMTRYISVVAPVSAHVPTVFQYFLKFMTLTLRESVISQCFIKAMRMEQWKGLTVELSTQTFQQAI